MTISSSLLKFIEEFFRITWLSVSSSKFYQDLYKKYNGYGIKYIAMAITITSIIYALFIYDTLATVRYYLKATSDEGNNPVEHILKQWPEVKYDGKSISIDNEEPIILNTISGKVAIAIDPENKLSSQQRLTIPIILQKNQILLNFVRPKEADAKPSEMSLGYGQIFSTEPYLLTAATLKSSLLDILQPIGYIILLVVIPILTLARLVIHIASSLFSIVILFGILWWLKLKPTVKSTSRIVLFSSGAAEIISPLIIIFAPGMLLLVTLVEYWAVILAVYSLSKMNRSQ